MISTNFLLSLSILLIFLEKILANGANDISKCFVLHKNIRLSCATPIERRTMISLIECEELCLSHPADCISAQYDQYRKTCDLYNVASPFSEEVPSRYRREVTRFQTAKTWSNEKGCSGSPIVQPSIGTTHLIPRLTCLLNNELRQDVRFSEAKKAEKVEKTSEPTDDSEPEAVNVPITMDKPEVSKPVSTNPAIGRLALSPPSLPDATPPESKAHAPPHAPPNGHQFEPANIEVLPIVPDCPIGERARVQIIDRVEANVTAAISFRIETPEKCVHACRTSTYPDSSRLPLLCRSAQFNRLSLTCSVFSDALNPNGYLEYIPNNQVIYMEKLCISDTYLPLGCDEVFRRVPQHVLLGHASEILTATSQLECIRECVEAKKNHFLICRSILHYPDIAVSNCILNVHTHLTKPDYFIPELRYKVDYVSLPSCAVEDSDLKIALRGSDASRFDELLSVDDITEVEDAPSVNTPEKSGWTEWTKCDKTTSTRRRERGCTDCVERMEIQPCFGTDGFNDAVRRFVKEKESDGDDTDIILPPKQSETKPEIIPFPLRESMLDQKPMAKTSDVEFFGPPFKESEFEKKVPSYYGKRRLI